MKTVLTIAGFDPSSGAGITADLMTFAAHGLFGTSCVTALTVQSTVGVVSIHPVEPDIVASTLQCLQADLPPAGIKVGMLGSGDNTNIISRYIGQLKSEDSERPVVVLDPVVRSSSGSELIDAEGRQILREQLLPQVDWIMPNVDELSWLSGQRVATRDELRNAARAFQDQTARLSATPVSVLAKGGHLEVPDDLLLTPDGRETWLAGERIETQATHGTGCALSSAFLSRLVLGEPPEQAAKGAKEYVTMAMRTADPIGHGRGPMNHLWPFRQARNKATSES